jgi:hypothetical protein
LFDVAQNRGFGGVVRAIRITFAVVVLKTNHGLEPGFTDDRKPARNVGKRLRRQILLVIGAEVLVEVCCGVDQRHAVLAHAVEVVHVGEITSDVEAAFRIEQRGVADFEADDGGGRVAVEGWFPAGSVASFG